MTTKQKGLLVVVVSALMFWALVATAGVCGWQRGYRVHEFMTNPGDTPSISGSIYIGLELTIVLTLGAIVASCTLASGAWMLGRDTEAGRTQTRNT